MTSNSIYYISTKHYVGGNKYRFEFPSGHNLKLKSGSQVAVASVNIYNSFFNITSGWGNNVFYLFSESLNLNAIPAGYEKGSSFIDPLTGVTTAKKYVKIVITDGYYDVSRLNYYLQQQLVTIGFYLKNALGENMYFYEFETNPTLYKCQVNCLVMPTALPTGFTYPSNTCFTLPATAQVPYVYLPASSSVYGSIATILGFPQGTYLPKQPDNTPITVVSENLSTIVPVVSVVSDVIFAINIVNNPLMNPPNSFFSIPVSSAFGALVSQSYYPVPINTIESPIQSLELTLYDQNYNPLQINDTQFNLGLLIISPTEGKK
jgi:hypothetical protein